MFETCNGSHQTDVYSSSPVKICFVHVVQCRFITRPLSGRLIFWYSPVLTGLAKKMETEQSLLEYANVCLIFGLSILCLLVFHAQTANDKNFCWSITVHWFNLVRYDRGCFGDHSGDFVIGLWVQCSPKNSICRSLPPKSHLDPPDRTQLIHRPEGHLSRAIAGLWLYTRIYLYTHMCTHIYTQA